MIGNMQWRARQKTWVGRVRGNDGARAAWHDLRTTLRSVATARLEHWIATGEAPSSEPAPSAPHLVTTQAELTALYGAGFTMPAPGAQLEIVRVMAGESEAEAERE